MFNTSGICVGVEGRSPDSESFLDCCILPFLIHIAGKSHVCEVTCRCYDKNLTARLAFSVAIMILPHK